MGLKKIFKFNKRKILTIAVIVVVFVMTLGYAALSQRMDIDGVAVIDRSWIIKITDVAVSVTNDGEDNGTTPVGTTVTMHSTLPNSNSTVTYKITLENQGNIVAKLSSIEEVEDDNTTITYNISGVTEGETLLKPGQTNTVVVTIKYASGVTNASNTKKDLMLNFNYAEDEKQSIIGDSDTTVGNGNIVFKRGDSVTLVDGTEWEVVKDSGSDSELVTLVSVYHASSSGTIQNSDNGNIYTIAFDSSGSNMYDPTSKTNVGYFLENTVAPALKNSINNAGGDATGLDVRLLTVEEYDSDIFFIAHRTWLMNPATDAASYGSNNKVYALEYSNPKAFLSTYSNNGVAPVITILKKNIKTMDLGIRISKIDNQALSDSVLDFSTTGGVLRYNQNIGTSSSYTVFSDSGTYIFGDNYKFNYLTGEYSLTGSTTSGTWSSMSDKYTSYPFTCKLSDGAGTCTTLYKMASYTNTTSGYGYKYTVTAILDSGGSGYSSAGALYYTATNTENNKTTYYFRGNARNNHVTFAGYNWRIIRVNEDGSIRMIKTSNIGTTLFDNGSNYIGSQVQNMIDSWYQSHLQTNYASYLIDAGFCNDRTVYGTGSTFGAYGRLSVNKSPQFACPNADDLLTTSSNSSGEKLNYPIGLITADEVAYAGNVFVPYSQTNGGSYPFNGRGSNTYYLFHALSGQAWTMTPIGAVDQWSGTMAYISPSYFTNYDTNSSSTTRGVYPVINLKADVKTITGDGTSNNPYRIS